MIFHTEMLYYVRHYVAWKEDRIKYSHFLISARMPYFEILEFHGMQKYLI